MVPAHDGAHLSAVALASMPVTRGGARSQFAVGSPPSSSRSMAFLVASRSRMGRPRLWWPSFLLPLCGDLRRWWCTRGEGCNVQRRPCRCVEGAGVSTWRPLVVQVHRWCRRRLRCDRGEGRHRHTYTGQREGASARRRRSPQSPGASTWSHSTSAFWCSGLRQSLVRLAILEE